MTTSFRDPSPRFPSLLLNEQVVATSAAHTIAVHRQSARADVVSKESLTQRATSEGRKHHRIPLKNVYQQPLTDSKTFTPPVYQHSDAERNMILAALRQNFVFSDLSEAELEPLVDAFQAVSCDAGVTIIKQGDPGDYFYVLVSGKVVFEVNGIPVGDADTAAMDGGESVVYSFGELALLYTCPRAATVVAVADETHLFRVDHRTFRYILQAQTKKSEHDKFELLRQVPFLEHLAETDLLKLSAAMTPRVFGANETLAHKGEAGDSFYVVKEGTVVCTDIRVGNTSYSDVTLTSGDYFGEYSIIKNEPRVANVVSLSKGVAFTIDRDCLATVLGDMSTLILRGQDSRKLCGVNFFKTLSAEHRVALADMIQDRLWNNGDTIVREGEACTAALYIVRQGELRVVGSDNREYLVGVDGYFGEQLLELASVAETSDCLSLAASPFTVTATQDCVCGVLTWDSILDVLLAIKDATVEPRDRGTGGPPEYIIRLENLQKQMILGQGTFGQCWLVSDGSSDIKKANRRPYALKIQCKADLINEGQALAVVREKDIMLKIKHPFIIELVSTYQDDRFVYMLLEFVQGGELFSVLHRSTDGLPDAQAKFYSLCVASALEHLHRPPSRFVYRDLKPENIMIDLLGYPKLIDFGFCKSVPDKTYTLCGTPGYLPPEIVMTRGHNYSADHWSLGILIYEMVTGCNPFYYEGMDQMSLFESVVVGDYDIPEGVSPEAYDIIDRLLVKDPTHRLGSLARGERDILEHSWFDGLDLQALLRREIRASWVPNVTDPFDTSCFDDWSELVDKTKQSNEALSKHDASIFADF